MGSEQELTNLEGETTNIFMHEGSLSYFPYSHFYAEAREKFSHNEKQ